MSGIYKTAGTTPRERWKDRAQVMALLILGWVLGGISVVLVSTILWYSGGAPLWFKTVFAVGDLIMLWGFVLMSADVVHAFRTDWILHKARKRRA